MGGGVVGGTSLANGGKNGGGTAMSVCEAAAKSNQARVQVRAKDINSN